MVFNLQSGHEYIVEMAIFNIYYVQMATTPEVGYPELRFFLVCMLSHGALHFLRNFIIISGTVFNLQLRQGYMVEMAMFNVQRAITPKVGKPELLFMCSECSLIVLYICVKFRENILGRYQSYGVDTNVGSADGRTGPRKDRHSKFWTV